MVVGAATLRAGERQRTCRTCGLLGICSPSIARTSFYRSGRYAGGEICYRSRCKACEKDGVLAYQRRNREASNARAARGKAAMMRDPAKRARILERERKRARRKRAVDPEPGREADRRYKAKVRARMAADEEFRAAQLRKERERAHARARAAGIAPCPAKRRYPEPVDEERTHRLPMTLAFQRWATMTFADAGSGSAATELLGIDERNLRNITGGLTQSIGYDTADRMLSGGDGPPLVAFWPHLG